MSNHTSTPSITSSPFANALVRATKFVSRLASTGASAGNDEIWQLYRMSRGSDSIRPSVIRHLAAHAAR